MVILAVGLAVNVLTRLAGNISRAFYGPGGPGHKGIEDLRRLARESKDPELREAAGYLPGWVEVADGLAYDSIPDLLTDLAALGVKAGLLRLGVPLGQRLLATLGTKAAGEALETMFDFLGIRRPTGLPAIPTPEAIEDIAQRRLENIKEEPAVREALKVAETSINLVDQVVTFAGAPSLEGAIGVGTALLAFSKPLAQFLGTPTPKVPPGGHVPPGKPLPKGTLQRKLVRQGTLAILQMLKGRGTRREREKLLRLAG